MFKCFLFSFYALLIRLWTTSLDTWFRCNYFYCYYSLFDDESIRHGSETSLLYTRAINMTVSIFGFLSLPLLPFIHSSYFLFFLREVLLSLLHASTSISSSHYLVYLSTHCKIFFLTCNINAAVKKTTPSYSNSFVLS